MPQEESDAARAAERLRRGDGSALCTPPPDIKGLVVDRGGAGEECAEECAEAFESTLETLEELLRLRRGGRRRKPLGLGKPSYTVGSDPLEWLDERLERLELRRGGAAWNSELSPPSSLGKAFAADRDKGGGGGEGGRSFLSSDAGDKDSDFRGLGALFLLVIGDTGGTDGLDLTA